MQCLMIVPRFPDTCYSYYSVKEEAMLNVVCDLE